MRFAYDGFEQFGDNRHFLFRAVEGSDSKPLSIQIDLGLMAKNGLSMQEAPMFCLQLLNGATHGTPDWLNRFVCYTVVHADLASMVAERQQKASDKLSRKAPRRPFRRPPTQSNLHLGPPSSRAYPEISGKDKQQP